MARPSPRLDNLAGDERDGPDPFRLPPSGAADADAAWVGRIGSPACLVEADGRLLAANPAARALAGRGLDLREGRLTLAAPAAQAALERVLKATGAGGPGGVLAADRGAAGRPLALQVRPLGGPDDAGRALVLISEDADDRTAALRGMGLTGAEARVADLVGRGLSAQDAAAALGKQPDTVRVHLRSIHNKLKISRRGQLVRLVMTLSPPANLCLALVADLTADLVGAPWPLEALSAWA